MTAVDSTAPSHLAADGFDFWLGDWEATLTDGTTATNRITRVLGGRVVLEDFKSASLNGSSVSVFNAKRGEWLQTWVDDSGSYLLFVGRRDPSEMRLDGRTPDGRPTNTRMRWHDIGDAAFEWDYEKLADGGAWDVLWHISYRRA